VNFSADERAELIGAVTRTSEMVGALLDWSIGSSSDSTMGGNSHQRTSHLSASTRQFGGSSLRSCAHGWRV
jgi:hypothetical protein